MLLQSWTHSIYFVAQKWMNRRGAISLARVQAYLARASALYPCVYRAGDVVPFIVSFVRETEVDTNSCSFLEYQLLIAKWISPLLGLWSDTRIPNVSSAHDRET